MRDLIGPEDYVGDIAVLPRREDIKAAKDLLWFYTWVHSITDPTTTLDEDDPPEDVEEGEDKE